MGTFTEKTQMKCYKRCHFIRVHKICLDKIDLQRKKYKIVLEIITCDPSMYTMDHPNFIICSFIENSEMG